MHLDPTYTVWLGLVYKPRAVADFDTMKWLKSDATPPELEPGLSQVTNSSFVKLPLQICQYPILLLGGERDCDS